MKVSRISDQIKTRILKGEVEDLICPKSYIVECNKKGQQPDEQYLAARGYNLPWGQLVEKEDDDRVFWYFRFDPLHAEYILHGVDSTDLADMSRLYLTGWLCQERLPSFFNQCNTLPPTTSTGIFCAKTHEKKARRYLVNYFLARPGAKPLIKRMLTNLAGNLAQMCMHESGGACPYCCSRKALRETKQ